MPRFEPSSELPEDVPNDAAVEEALKTVPKGALALAGTAMSLLILAWLFVYFFVFLPRGPIS